MTHYAYYKDSQFRIIPEGLMPKEFTPKNAVVNDAYLRVCRNAKDQSVLAEDQRLIQHKVIDRLKATEGIFHVKEDTIYPFEYDGTIEEIVLIPREHLLTGSDVEQECMKHPVARLIPSKPKEVNSAHSHTDGSEEILLGPEFIDTSNRKDKKHSLL